jgi:3-oxoacyl-[acyl-carrier protein] reductase
MSKSRTVVITGGNSGIGRAITKKFADNGDKVFVLGLNEEKLAETEKLSENVKAYNCDITNPTNVDATKELIVADSGNIDVLVNCAGGTTKVGDNPDFTEARKVWDYVIDLNLTGVFNMIFAFEPHLTRPGGRIINITSLAAFTGSSRHSINGEAYATAKSGIHGMSRHLAIALAKDGITVNCVAPGVIDHTGFFGGDGLPEDRKKVNEELTPLGRVGTPEDIAPGVFYLASEEAEYITGEILNINGGRVFGR